MLADEFTRLYFDKAKPVNSENLRLFEFALRSKLKDKEGEEKWH